MIHVYIHVRMAIDPKLQLNFTLLCREVKVHVSKPGSVGRFMSTLTKKKYNTNTETFRLLLKKIQVSCMGINLACMAGGGLYRMYVNVHVT